jgi:hypothetical protein
MRIAELSTQLKLILFDLTKDERWERWFKCNFIPSHRNELPHLSIVLESVRYMNHPLNQDDLTYKNYREKSRHLSYVFLD